MELVTLFALVSELVALAGALTPIFIKQRKLQEGIKCQLRSEMLRTYYHNREKKTIRQYEYENFVFLYEAYKSLKGNSFIDEIYEKIQKWEIVS